MEQPLKSDAFHRPVRSFVLRQGRLTTAQERILQEKGPAFLLDPATPEALPWKDGRPLLLEIGFGNGEHLAHFSATHPDWGCIGAEVHRPGVGALLLRAEDAGLQNLQVLNDDVVPWLKAMPGAPFRLVVIQFPDPWPKKRHHKRRLVQPGLARLLVQRLAPGGELQLATDWEDYAWQMLEVLEAATGLRNMAGPGSFSPRPENRIPTRFERRGEALGHRVYDLRFIRTGEE